MYNKCLEYLLSNNPDDVMSKSGVVFRKMLNPIIRGAGKLIGPYHLEILRKEPVRIKNPITLEEKEYNKRPIIFVPTHGFKDDFLYSIITMRAHAYALHASIPYFYNSFDGILLWLNGVLIINRRDKESKKSALPKVSNVIKLGANVTYFPEGTWNKSPNLLVLDLWNGIIKAAKENNALLVPIATMTDDDKICYSIQDSPIDVCNMDSKEAKIFLRDTLASIKWEIMEHIASVNGISKREDFEDGYWDDYVKKLIEPVKNLYDYEIENNSEYIDPTKVSEEEVFGCLDNVKLTSNNAYVLTRTRNNRKG